MRKVLFYLIGILVCWLVVGLICVNIGWLILNELPKITNVEDILKIQFTFNIQLLQSAEYAPYRYLSLLATGLIVLTIFGNIISTKSEARRRFKTKYERMNYVSWLSTFSRMRGTVRIKFDKNGKAVYSGIFEIFSRLKHPFAVLQNKYADWRQLPAPKRWTPIPTFQNNGETTRLSGGVPVVALRKYLLFGKYNQVYSITGDMHSLFVGPTRRGKTMTFVLPMIYSYINAQENMVIHDPKGELYAHSKAYLEQSGYKVIKIDFVNPECSDGWNPFDVPYRAWKEAIAEYEEELMKTHVYHDGEYLNSVTGEIIEHKALYKKADLSDAVGQVLDIAKTLSFEEDSKNPFFHEGAGDTIAGGALFMMEEGKSEYVNAKSVRYLIELGDKGKEDETILTNYLDNHREVDSPSRSRLGTYLSAKGVTRSGIKATFNNKMSLLTSTEAIIKMTSNSTFDMHDIFTEKTAVFLMTHDEKSTYYPLVTMFFNQLYHVGIKVSRKNPNRRLKIPMNWMIDEMSVLPEIKDIEAIYAASAGRGLRINGFIQSFEQLIDKYEANTAKVIEDNSANVIYLGSQLEETRNRFSKMVGKELVWNRKKKEFEERPLITPERFQRFERGRSLILSMEWNPYIAKLPPFTKYSFCRKPDWNKELIEKPEVKFFNINDEIEKERKSSFDKKNTPMLDFPKKDLIDTRGLIKKTEDELKENRS